MGKTRELRKKKKTHAKILERINRDKWRMKNPWREVLEKFAGESRHTKYTSRERKEKSYSKLKRPEYTRLSNNQF